MRGLHITPLSFLLVALALLAVACSTGTEVSVEPAVTATATPSATVAPTQAPATAVAATPSATPEPTPEPYDGELAAMRIPALGVDAAIEYVGTIPGRRQLAAPGPHTVGWYHIYDKPGFGTSSLYSAHKDYWPDIKGPFHSLTDLGDGDEIIVVMDDGREYVYEVFLQRRYTVDDIPMNDLIKPEDADDPDLRRPAGEEWITLITCGGEFVVTAERGSGIYLHRDVVIARRVDGAFALAANVP